MGSGASSTKQKVYKSDAVVAVPPAPERAAQPPIQEAKEASPAPPLQQSSPVAQQPEPSARSPPPIRDANGQSEPKPSICAEVNSPGVVEAKVSAEVKAGDSSAGDEDGPSKKRKGKHKKDSHKHKKESKKRRHSRSRRRSSRGSRTFTDGPLDRGKLLFESMPYYAGGDAATKSMMCDMLEAATTQELSQTDQYGNTILILALQYGAMDLAVIILEKGCIDVNAVNSAGAGAIHFPCYKDTFDAGVARALLAGGAKADVAESTYGCTPLHYAAGSGDVALCKDLIEAGADVSKCDFYNFTAVDYARQSGMSACEAYLTKLMPASPMKQEVLTSKTTKQGGGLVMAEEAGELMPEFGQRRDSLKDVTNSAAYQGKSLAEANGAESDDEFDMQTPSLRQAASAVAFWSRHKDPESGLPYHMNETTGESIWESELMEQAKALSSGEGNGGEESVAVRQWLKQQSYRARLIAYLGKHAPLRLIEMETLLKDNLGNPDKLFKSLVKEYGVAEESSLTTLSADSESGFRGRASFTTTSATANPLIQSPSIRSQRPPSAILRPGRPTTSTATTPSPLRKNMSTNSLLGGTSSVPSAVSPPPMATLSKVASLMSMQLSPADLKLKEEKAAKLIEEENASFEEKLEQCAVKHREALGDQDGRLAQLVAQTEAAREQIARARTKSATLAETCSRLQDQLNKVAAENSTALGSLQAEASTLEAEVNAKRKEVADLTATMEKHQSGALEAARAAQEEADKHAAEEVARMSAIQAQKSKVLSRINGERSALESEWGAERKAIESDLQGKLSLVYQEIKTTKLTAATDVHRALTEAESAVGANKKASKARFDAVAARDSVEKEVLEARLMVGRNVVLQGYMTRETERRKLLHNKMEDLKGKIRVYVRVRPFSTKEKERGCENVVSQEGKQCIIVQDKKNNVEKSWDFDQVWCGTEAEGNTQEAIFKDTGYLVTSAVDGFNVCIFAYGQTGAGKSFTMMGAGGVGGGMDTSTGVCTPGAGVTPRAVGELFRVLKERQPQYTSSVTVSMFELYRDGLRDLQLKKSEAPAKLIIKLAEHSGTGLVVVEGGVEVPANSVKELVDAISAGAERRAVASTQMNSDSSRSHLICSIVICSTNARTGSVVRGKLTLVDLAGSERVGKSGAAGDQLKEAQSINKSLSALGDVISSLTTGSAHIPYRNHPLTMMMSDSLGGASKTLMFMCASPADYNSSETINSLQFAARCKDVVNAGGPGAQAQQLQALRRELNKLRGDGVGAKSPTQLGRPG